jgi:ankyrin repeat protein
VEVVAVDLRRIDLGRARREAKVLLTAARTGEPDALARIRAVGGELRLASAQLAAARELGEPSWPALVRRAERESASRRERAEAFVRAATSDRIDHADALLDADQAILRTLPAAALVVGAPVDVDPQLPLPPLGWQPLLYVTHSRYLGGARSDALVSSAARLLDAGADPNASYADPEFGAQSALYGAAGIAHEPRLTGILLARGANPDDGESLYHATEATDLTCVRLLLEAGATVSGTNALAHALDREDGELVSLLLDHGQPPGTPWDELDRAVPWAIYRNRSARLVRLLAERGANLEVRDARTGRTPYALAIARGRPDVAEVLAELGAPSEASPLDMLIGDCLRGDRESALARSERDPALVAAAEPDLAQALVIAAGEGRVEATALLLDVGARIDARGELAGTALHHAAWQGRGGTVDLLLRRGADPLALAPEPASGTPLAWAAHGSRHAGQHGDAYLGIGRRLVAAGDVRDPALAERAAGGLADWLAGRDELDPAPTIRARGRAEPAGP